jgi:hypothetical protein
VAGKRLVHLQCHIGLDTVRLARRGAIVTGLDFSPPTIAAAPSLAAAELDAPSVLSRVMSTTRRRCSAANTISPLSLGDRSSGSPTSAVGRRSLRDCWRPAAGSISPRGTRRPCHSMRSTVGCYPCGLADIAIGALCLRRRYYYTRLLHQRPDADRPYAELRMVAPVERHHRQTIGGRLQLDSLHEHERFPKRQFPMMVKADDWRYRLPDGHPPLPLPVSLRTSKRARF